MAAKYEAVQDDGDSLDFTDTGSCEAFAASHCGSSMGDLSVARDES